MTDAVEERFDRFARQEAPERSPVYQEWARGIAADPEMCRLLALIPDTHRQPPLVFAVSRLLGAADESYPRWREFVMTQADDLVAECGRRMVQANEPLRLAALLPALSLVPGPIALLELGAAAGMCLYPDRYSYVFRDEQGAERTRLDPEDGRSAVVLDSAVRGVLPSLRMPEVVWRGGIDLAPVDVSDPDGRAWVRAQVWPGEYERAQRVEAAMTIVASDPPRMWAGDAEELLSEALAAIPADATPVITTPGLLVYLPWQRRQALVQRLRSAPAHWVSIDPVRLHDGWNARDPEGFGVGWQGTQVADADPLGRWWEWRTE